MVGVSTGSIIVALLAFKNLAVADVESIYNEVGKQVFTQSYLGGITGMVKSHSYYDTASYQRILQVRTIYQVSFAVLIYLVLLLDRTGSY